MFTFYSPARTHIHAHAHSHRSLARLRNWRERVRWPLPGLRGCLWGEGDESKSFSSSAVSTLKNGGACYSWPWMGSEKPSPPASQTADILGLIWALQDLERQRTILTSGSIVGRGCPSCLWQVCRSARGWWEGVCQVSAEEKEPQCQLVRH